MGLFSFGSSSKEEKNEFPWRMLTSIDQLEEIMEDKDHFIVLFKHSTRCSISSMAKSSFERRFPKEHYDQFRFYYLDLLNYRDISAAIAEKFNVVHQSPQAVVVKNNQVLYHASHTDIDAFQVADLNQ